MTQPPPAPAGAGPDRPRAARDKPQLGTGALALWSIAWGLLCGFIPVPIFVLAGTEAGLETPLERVLALWDGRSLARWELDGRMGSALTERAALGGAADVASAPGGAAAGQVLEICCDADGRARRLGLTDEVRALEVAPPPPTVAEPAYPERDPEWWSFEPQPLGGGRFFARVTLRDAADGAERDRRVVLHVEHTGHWVAGPSLGPEGDAPLVAVMPDGTALVLGPTRGHLGRVGSDTWLDVPAPVVGHLVGLLATHLHGGVATFLAVVGGRVLALDLRDRTWQPLFALDGWFIDGALSLSSGSVAVVAWRPGQRQLGALGYSLWMALVVAATVLAVSCLWLRRRRRFSLWAPAIASGLMLLFGSLVGLLAMVAIRGS